MVDNFYFLYIWLPKFYLYVLSEISKTYSLKSLFIRNNSLEPNIFILLILSETVLCLLFTYSRYQKLSYPIDIIVMLMISPEQI